VSLAALDSQALIVTATPDGIVLDHQVMVGNPPDAPLLAPAIRRVIARTARAHRL
jgi:IS5 family transposase